MRRIIRSGVYIYANKTNLKMASLIIYKLENKKW